ncbi:MAG TPA: GC-type dockerin domain-anchored protein, partial [Phycisphaerales bacterium]|nr:GC-type dockerin domain-anchored protein [Phycisphaerales bacterium]HMP38501.1 GC-type dockerin domain-anchored protein [Phycisphaerales bacterium]
RVSRGRLGYGRRGWRNGHVSLDVAIEFESGATVEVALELDGAVLESVMVQPDGVTTIGTVANWPLAFGDGLPGAHGGVTAVFPPLTSFVLDAGLRGGALAGEPAPIVIDRIRVRRTDPGADAPISDFELGFIGFRSVTLSDPVTTLPTAPPNPCPADLTGDGAVDGADLGLLLSSWGGTGSADLNNDGVVDGADLGLLLSGWGACP